MDLDELIVRAYEIGLELLKEWKLSFKAEELSEIFYYHYGSPIPFKRHGFDSLDALLVNSDYFERCPQTNDIRCVRKEIYEYRYKFPPPKGCYAVDPESEDKELFEVIDKSYAIGLHLHENEKKPSFTPKEISKIYRSIYGKPIPHRKLGFRTLEEIFEENEHRFVFCEETNGFMCRPIEAPSNVIEETKSKEAVVMPEVDPEVTQATVTKEPTILPDDSDEEIRALRMAAKEREKRMRVSDPGPPRFFVGTLRKMSLSPEPRRMRRSYSRSPMRGRRRRSRSRGGRITDTSRSPSPRRGRRSSPSPKRRSRRSRSGTVSTNSSPRRSYSRMPRKNRRSRSRGKIVDSCRSSSPGRKSHSTPRKHRRTRSRSCGRITDTSRSSSQETKSRTRSPSSSPKMWRNRSTSPRKSQVPIHEQIERPQKPVSSLTARDVLLSRAKSRASLLKSEKTPSDATADHTSVSDTSPIGNPPLPKKQNSAPLPFLPHPSMSLSRDESSVFRPSISMPQNSTLLQNACPPFLPTNSVFFQRNEPSTIEPLTSQNQLKAPYTDPLPSTTFFTLEAPTTLDPWCFGQEADPLEPNPSSPAVESTTQQKGCLEQISAQLQAPTIPSTIESATPQVSCLDEKMNPVQPSASILPASESETPQESCLAQNTNSPQPQAPTTPSTLESETPQESSLAQNTDALVPNPSAPVDESVPLQKESCLEQNMNPSPPPILPTTDSTMPQDLCLVQIAQNTNPPQPSASILPASESMTSLESCLAQNTNPLQLLAPTPSTIESATPQESCLVQKTDPLHPPPTTAESTTPQEPSVEQNTDLMLPLRIEIPPATGATAPTESLLAENTYPLSPQEPNLLTNESPTPQDLNLMHNTGSLPPLASPTREVTTPPKPLSEENSHSLDPPSSPSAAESTTPQEPSVKQSTILLPPPPLVPSTFGSETPENRSTPLSPNEVEPWDEFPEPLQPPIPPTFGPSPAQKSQPAPDTMPLPPPPPVLLAFEWKPPQKTKSTPCNDHLPPLPPPAIGASTPRKPCLEQKADMPPPLSACKVELSDEVSFKQTKDLEQFLEPPPPPIPPTFGPSSAQKSQSDPNAYAPPPPPCFPQSTPTWNNWLLHQADLMNGKPNSITPPGYPTRNPLLPHPATASSNLFSSPGFFSGIAATPPSGSRRFTRAASERSTIGGSPHYLHDPRLRDLTIRIRHVISNLGGHGLLPQIEEAYFRYFGRHLQEEFFSLVPFNTPPYILAEVSCGEIVITQTPEGGFYFRLKNY